MGSAPGCTLEPRAAVRAGLGLHRRLVYANLRLAWFDEFQRYGVDELGNRPIHPHDFYFLAGVYRQRLQTIHFEHIENASSSSSYASFISSMGKPGLTARTSSECVARKAKARGRQLPGMSRIHTHGSNTRSGRRNGRGHGHLMLRDGSDGDEGR